MCPISQSSFTIPSIITNMSVCGFSHGRWMYSTNSLYTTQAGSTILFWTVFSLCEIQKLLVTLVMPNSSIMIRNIF